VQYIEKGTADFKKVKVGFFLGGLATFAAMHCAQPLLPLYSREFHVSPVTSSLVLSITTAILAVMMTFTAFLSNTWGRKNIMVISLFGTSLVTIASALSPNFATLLLCRALEGIFLAGIPAIAITYLGEEVHPQYQGASIGIFIGGNAIGGMLGRIATGVITDLSSWRIAITCIGLVGLFCSWWFWKNLPPSTHFTAQTFSARKHITVLVQQLNDPCLLCLYGIAFLLMGSFMTLYSYLGYQLTMPPYNLSQALISWIFIIYIVGSLSSSWSASLADRWSQQRVLLINAILLGLGALITLSPNLPVKIFGVAASTLGYFGGHAIASSWVNKRARNGKAQACALYLFFFYVGSSVGNTTGGFFWSADGWSGVIEMISIFALGILVLVLLLPLFERRTKAQFKKALAAEI
jgi:YNFM family putative membrane transporter